MNGIVVYLIAFAPRSSVQDENRLGSNHLLLHLSSQKPEGRVGRRTRERLLPRFKVFCGKDPYPAEKIFLGAWSPRFGVEVALLECPWYIVHDVKDLRQEMWI